MNYHEFQNTILKMIRDRIADGWMPEASAVTEMMTKNNGTEVCSLFIRKEDEMVAPAIYLEDYYDMFLDGKELDRILDLICRHYEHACSKLPPEMASPENFEEVKPFIIYRIVNFDKNRELLRSCPCIPLLDLAVTFRWLALSDEYSISSAMITNYQMDFWGINLSDLLELARVNTRRLFPEEIRPVEESIAEMCALLELFGVEEDQKYVRELKQSPVYPMFVMTNEKGINGATCLIYENVLKDFADRLKEGFYIIPSSVHEVIMIPESWIEDPAELGFMVREVNEKAVPSDEILSDSVYHYDMEKNCLELAVCA